MSTILTTPPSVEPVSLAEAKAQLRITHSDDDAFISTLIITARRLVELRCNLCLMPQSWSVFKDRWPDINMLALPLHPVQSVIDVKIYGDDDVAATLDPASYFLDSATRPARLVLRQNQIFPQPGRRANGIEVRVTTGFAALPQPIKQALLIVIADYYTNRGDVSNGALPMPALELLAPYREVRLA